LIKTKKEKNVQIFERSLNAKNKYKSSIGRQANPGEIGNNYSGSALEHAELYL